jgi:hypothetical protein
VKLSSGLASLTRVQDEYGIVNNLHALIEKGSLHFCTATAAHGDKPGRFFVVAGGDVLLSAGAVSKSSMRDNDYYRIQTSYAIVIEKGYLRTAVLG